MLRTARIEIRRQCGLEDARRNRAQLRRRALGAPTRFQPAHHRQPPARSALQLAVFSINDRFRAQRHRHIKISADFYTVEIRGRHANDRERMPVNGDRSPQYRPLAPVLSLPERIANRCPRRRAPRLVIFRGKQPSEDRLYSERLEKIAAHPQSLDVMYFPARRDIEKIRPPREHVGKSLLLRANLL